MPLEYDKILKELDECNKPLFLFDDDADGLASFLLLYRYKREGQGFIVKSSPLIDEQYLKKVQEFQPDKIFILDIAMVKESFTEEVKVPIIWIDHHGPYRVNNTKYFNPRLKDKNYNVPTSYLCYRVVKQDLWIAMTGIVGDWIFIPDLFEEFSNEFSDLLPKEINTPEKALFETQIGKMSKIFNFVLKGESRSALQCAKVLTRIKDPYEIFNQTSPQGKYLWKKFQKLEIEYQKTLTEAIKQNSDDSILLYKYNDNNMSFTSELANELLYRFPEKIIIIARFNNGEAKCSVRSGKKIILPPIVENALIGIQGYGGGHEHACGCCVKEEQLDEFVNNLRIAVKKKQKKK